MKEKGMKAREYKKKKISGTQVGIAREEKMDKEL